MQALPEPLRSSPAAAAASPAGPVAPEVKGGFGFAVVGVRDVNPLAFGASDASPSEVPGSLHEDYIASPSLVLEQSSRASAAASPGASDLLFNRWAQPFTRARSLGCLECFLDRKGRWVTSAEGALRCCD